MLRCFDRGWRSSAPLRSLGHGRAPAAAAAAPGRDRPCPAGQLVRRLAGVQPPADRPRQARLFGARRWPPRRARLPEFQRRLAAIDTTGWSASQRGDYRLVEAEMNGLDFFLRVLKPWARDPGFYQTVFAEMSDVPAHEGPSAEPNIDLLQFHLSAVSGRRCAADRAARRGPGAARRCARSISPAARRTICGPMATAPSTSRPRCWRSSRRAR